MVKAVISGGSYRNELKIPNFEAPSEQVGVPSVCGCTWLCARSIHGHRFLLLAVGLDFSNLVLYFFDLVAYAEDFLWGYVGAPLIVVVGLYLSFKSRFVQVRKFPAIVHRFIGYLTYNNREHAGVHPLKAFFAAVGGCIGIGNIVGVCTAVQFGGPGALFWVWFTALMGMMFKYSEVYLGIRFREQLPDGQYRGGPMYFLRRAYKGALLPLTVAVLLCVYGVEVYQFRVITKSITDNFQWNEQLTVMILLFLVIFASSGGVRRVGAISGAIIPLFIFIYVGMGIYVLYDHIWNLPQKIAEVFVTAFTGHAAVGGFVGSTMMLAMSHGVRRGAYSGDVGIGYSSVIHSQSSVTRPQNQASLVIFDMFLDSFVICTMTIMIILVTDVWQMPIEAGMLVQTALSAYFPYMHYFMPLFLFILGYSTINAYFVVGLDCAAYISPFYGRSFFYVYAVSALLFFSFAETAQAMSVMAIVGCILLVINCSGIFKLRHEINFDV